MKQRLVKNLREEYLALGDFNLHNKSWGRPDASKTDIEKSEELLVVTQRWGIEQMVPVRMATNKGSTGKSTIDLIFAMSLLSESLISCKIAEEFDHDLDHQLVISK